CGGKAEIIRVTEKYPNYVINCHKCRISTAWYADVKQLSEFWNKRADEKHGKWILEREPDGKPYCFHCSICDSDFRYIGIKTAFDFCPNCGAKMETEEYK
ncbi:MAG: hypothetical protein PUG48_10835, partial [Clostridia bacterium]|nr:hypothetical protein [Clostridia bacterium]